ncbi:uncharacterized protein LOC115221630 isoform X1 [Octopus sinensis]|uniref:Uncharacterized protein LOC115221630 isoform X1 n=2 Tax=Octopus sinensis TaxID=2607531 RepID=A0A7E6FI23_9MOLL|nr:uncharacterized protein LOC115221630 isoform X1 [Octopus sinensis]
MMEAVENIDLSRLQQHSPHKELHLSLLDLMKYVSVGTSELLLYLLKETHIILECRTCSNLFRDVPYLVAHKRIYCKQRHDSATDIQIANRSPPDDEGKASVTVKPSIYEEHKDFLQHSVDLAKKVLQSSQVNHCAQMLPNNGPTKSQFYDAVQKQLEIARDNPEPTQLFSLEPMENTQVAVKVIPSDGDECSEEQKDENNDNTDISKESKMGSNLCELKSEPCDKLTTSPSTPTPVASETKIDSELDKPFLKSDLADFKNCICLKCNRTLSNQKSLGDHLLTVHAEELKERSDNCCSNANSSSQCHPINGLRPKVNKSDWLKPRGYSSSEKLQNKLPSTTNNSAKDILDAKKKAQANLLALKEEQLAYENEILQQKLIRGIMPKSSRGRKKFRCESCGKIFPKIESLRDHLRDCIDWEHVNQPVRNVRSPLPSLKEGNNSFDWPDIANDSAYKVQPPKLQNRSQTKIDNVRPPPRNIAPKVQPVTQIAVTDNSKLTKINGTLNTIAKSVMSDSLILANPKLGESKVLLFPLESISNNPKLNVTVKTQPQTTPTVLLNHNLNKISPTLNVIPVSICSVDNNNSNNNNNNTQVPLIATNGNNTNACGNFETKDVEIIAVKNSPNVPYQELRTVVTTQCWTEKVNSCSEAAVLNSESNVPGVAGRHLPNIQPCPVNLVETNCPDSICCKSCCNNEVQVLEHLSTAANKCLPDAASCSAADTEDVIVVSQSFSNNFNNEQTPNYLSPNDHVTKPPQCDKTAERNFTVALSGFENNSVEQISTKDRQTIKKSSPKNSKCIKWKRYKCKLCLFSAAKRHMCKLHVRQHHLCKIFTLSVKALNHYVTDLNRLTKKPTGSRQRHSQIQNKSFPSLSTKKSSKWKSLSQRSKELNQSHHSSSVSKLSKLSLTKSRVDMKTILDSKRRMCLKCNRTFQMVSRLEKHVSCHLGWKVNHSKQNLVNNNNKQLKQKTEGNCKENEITECMFVDLTGEQGATDSRHLPSYGISTAAGSSGTCSNNHWNSSNPTSVSHGNHGQLSVLNTRKGSYQKPQVLLDLASKNLKSNVKKVDS